MKEIYIPNASLHHILCIALLFFACSKKQAMLTTATPPGKPTGLQVSGITKNGSTIEWTPPTQLGKKANGSNATIAGYKLSVAIDKDFTTATTQIMTLSGSATQHTLSTLRAQTKYWVKLAAKNDNGDPTKEYGAATEALTFTTRAGGSSTPTPNDSKIKIHNGNYVASLVVSQSDFNSWNTKTINTAEGIANAKKVTQEVYKKFNDVFDFIILQLNNAKKPADMPYGEFLRVSNAVKGLGLRVFNDGAAYGTSAQGKLKGVIGLYNDIQRFGSGPILHEILHAWANFTPSTSKYFGGGHWPTDSGIQGKFASPGNTYAPLELYFMGMIGTPTQSVASWARGTAYRFTTSRNHKTYKSSAETGKTLFQTAFGLNRMPSYTTSQKEFRALFLVLTPTPLDEAKISGGTGRGKDANYNKQLEWMTATQNLEDLSHKYSLFVNNFRYDTNYKGTLTIGGLNASTK